MRGIIRVEEWNWFQLKRKSSIGDVDEYDQNSGTELVFDKDEKREEKGTEKNVEWEKKCYWEEGEPLAGNEREMSGKESEEERSGNEAEIGWRASRKEQRKSFWTEMEEKESQNSPMMVVTNGLKFDDVFMGKEERKSKNNSDLNV